MILKIIIDLVCGALNAGGGYHWLWMRRYVMPIVIGIWVSYFTHTWWIGVTVLPVIGTLCLGYFKGWEGRGGWLAMQAFVIGLGCLVTGHLAWYFFVPYVIGAFILGSTLYNLQQIIGDIIFGCWLGGFLFCLK